eukprot:TRINITY_DN17075_c0_g1_i1.p1 TRINITY_DN17075_c0_g1~~TRINITY_DN17075_c0_g1_i1.p1  ORF type:complete len:229 (+),score=24.77 TRINITY_DN17075_c0_g1_i1:84-770(+)
MPHQPATAFATVEEGVFRSAMPVASNISHLETLKLKSVLLLSNEPFERSVSAYFKDNSITVIELGKECWVPSSGWTGMNEVVMKRALEIIIDSNTYPILICCSSGLHLSGTVVGCLRKLQNWILSSVIEDYRVFAEPQHRTSAMNFISLFDTDVVNIPPSIPSWLESQFSQEQHDRTIFKGVTDVNNILYSPHDDRPAYQAYYFCLCSPPVSRKVRYDFSESIVIEED